jgi:hypothetical protein
MSKGNKRNMIGIVFQLNGRKRFSRVVFSNLQVPAACIISKITSKISPGKTLNSTIKLLKQINIYTVIVD